MIRFLTPFESGIRPVSGWRWYWRFLRDYPDMIPRVEHDCFSALDGLVIA